MILTNKAAILSLVVVLFAAELFCEGCAVRNEYQKNVYDDNKNAKYIPFTTMPSRVMINLPDQGKKEEGKIL